MGQAGESRATATGAALLLGRLVIWEIQHTRWSENTLQLLQRVFTHRWPLLFSGLGAAVLISALLALRGVWRPQSKSAGQQR